MDARLAGALLLIAIILREAMMDALSANLFAKAMKSKGNGKRPDDRFMLLFCIGIIVISLLVMLL